MLLKTIVYSTFILINLIPYIQSNLSQSSGSQPISIIPNCGNINEDCSQDNDCCFGFICSNTTGSGKCSTCDLQKCKEDSDCTKFPVCKELFCSKPENIDNSGSCGICHENGYSCKNEFDCCGTNVACTSGICTQACGETGSDSIERARRRFTASRNSRRRRASVRYGKSAAEPF